MAVIPETFEQVLEDTEGISSCIVVQSAGCLDPGISVLGHVLTPFNRPVYCLKKLQYTTCPAGFQVYELFPSVIRRQKTTKFVGVRYAR